jgi:hypothetical protein
MILEFQQAQGNKDEALGIIQSFGTIWKGYYILHG